MFPEAFLERMDRLLGAEYEAFWAALQKEHHRALHLNRLKSDIYGLSAAVRLAVRDGTSDEAANGFAHLKKVSWAEDGYYFDSKDQPGKHPFHEAGLYYIQEPSAMVPAELLDVRPGERVLDLCAAPGGKSIQIAAKLNGRGLLLCNEIHPARAKILSENVERMGICNAFVTNETPQRLSELFSEYFDKILVDAPCSGEGMFRKNRTAGEEWSPQIVAVCADRQSEILDCAARMLRPGGRLVYSTCTFAPEENEGSISRFLQRHREFEILPAGQENLLPAGCNGVPQWGDGRPDLVYTLRLWPHRVNGEGHFAAALQKVGAVEADHSNPSVNGTVKGLPERDLKELIHFCEENILSSGSAPLRSLEKALGLEEDFVYIKFGDNLYLVSVQTPDPKGMKVLRPGLHLGELKKNRFEPSHALALALRPACVSHTWELNSDKSSVTAYLSGRTFSADGEKGWYLICMDGFSLGWGKLAGGVMKNHYPKGLRIHLKEG